MFYFGSSVEAKVIDQNDILFNSYVIGSYLYTSDNNNIYNTKEEFLWYGN